MNRYDIQNFRDAQSMWAANGFRGPEPRLSVQNDRVKYSVSIIMAVLVIFILFVAPFTGLAV